MTQPFKWVWADGFHAPRGVSVEDVGPAVEDAKTPEALLEASKKRRHCLHDHLWSEGDQVWANRARKEECRTIIRHVRKEMVVGGATIEVRAVEFIRESDSWESMDDIIANPEMHDAYMGEIERLQEQALRKMSVFRLLLKG